MTIMRTRRSLLNNRFRCICLANFERFIRSKLHCPRCLSIQIARSVEYHTRGPNSYGRTASKLAQLSQELAIHRRSMLMHSQTHMISTMCPNLRSVNAHSNAKRRIIPDLVTPLK